MFIYPFEHFAFLWKNTDPVAHPGDDFQENPKSPQPVKISLNCIQGMGRNIKRNLFYHRQLNKNTIKVKDI